MQHDGVEKLREYLPQLAVLLSDSNREWGSALTYTDYRIITRIELASALLAASLQIEYKNVITPDKTWDTFQRDHGQQIHDYAASLLEKVL